MEKLQRLLDQYKQGLLTVEDYLYEVAIVLLEHKKEQDARVQRILAYTR